MLEGKKRNKRIINLQVSGSIERHYHKLVSNPLFSYLSLLNAEITDCIVSDLIAGNLLLIEWKSVQCFLSHLLGLLNDQLSLILEENHWLEAANVPLTLVGEGITDC